MRVRRFSSAEIMGGLSGSDEDAQRRNWLLGAGDTVTSFAGVFTRRSMGNLLTQEWRWHDEEEIEYIAAGKMRIQIADSTNAVVDDFEVGAGDLFFIPAGVRHRADAVGEETCIGVLFCPTAYPIPPGQTSRTSASP